MKKENNSKVLRFIRRNALYLILAFCILAVGFSITLMLIRQNNQASVQKPPVIEKPLPDDDNGNENTGNENTGNENTGTVTPEPQPTPVAKPIVFIMPVNETSSIGAYSETMVWCSTMGRFETHLAIDFFAQEGTSVFAVYDGTVESIESSLLEGYTITIDHGNGLKTVYNSLADGDQVVEGQAVKQGDIIGQVSVSNRQEYKDGAHLHFEVIENGAIIDPAKYLTIDEK